MDCRQILLKIAICVLILRSERTEARYNNFCNRWKSSCDKYETHCNQDNSMNSTTNENSTNSTNSANSTSESDIYKIQIWPSCCKLAESTDFVASSGVYILQNPLGAFTITQAYCDLNTSNGGWTVIQRRVLNSTENFNRSWYEYVQGFGSLEGDFWYGLNKIQSLTSENIYELRVEFTTIEGETITAEYGSFSVEGEEFKLVLGEQTGGSNDILRPFQENNFTTHDSNNSGADQYNCAALDRSFLLSGWWYTSICLGDKGVNLNGKFPKPADDTEFPWIINSTEMKIRPIGCNTSRSRKSVEGLSTVR